MNEYLKEEQKKILRKIGFKGHELYCFSAQSAQEVINNYVRMSNRKRKEIRYFMRK